MIPYNGGCGELLGCDVLVMSEAVVKLYRCRLTDSVKVKTEVSYTAGNIMPASYVTGQSSDLNTGISYIWVE